MLNILGRPYGSHCDRITRRSCLTIGSLGMAGLGLPTLLRARSQARDRGLPSPDTSVVWLWLAGGASQIETFDPKMDAPSEIRSTVGAVDTTLPGIQFGGLFPRIAKLAHHMAIFRSFSHRSTSHNGGPHWLVTGKEHRLSDTEGPIHPSAGSMLAKLRGPSHPVTGMPTYVRMGRIYGDGPAWLGVENAPFTVDGRIHQRMTASVELDRLNSRRHLLGMLDRVDRRLDHTGHMEGLDSFEEKAFHLILGRSKEAFDLGREDPRIRSRYARSGAVGEQLLLARRLCEAGCGCVTIHAPYDWDMHGIPGRPTIDKHLERNCPPVDLAIETFLEDLVQSGLDKHILLVISGDFGRTPRINPGGGRDHWGLLSTLALAGGGLRVGQVIGESTAFAEEPKTRPVTPTDLMATVFHVLGVDARVQAIDNSGQPHFLLDPDARPIPELF